MRLLLIKNTMQMHTDNLLAAVFSAWRGDVQQQRHEVRGFCLGAALGRVRDLREICARSVRDLREICARSARVLDLSCPRHPAFT